MNIFLFIKYSIHLYTIHSEIFINFIYRNIPYLINSNKNSTSVVLNNSFNIRKLASIILLFIFILNKIYL